MVGAASSGTLIAWFLLAPDPRFVLGPLWLAAAAPAAAATGLVHERGDGTLEVALLIDGLSCSACGAGSSRSSR